MKNSLENHHLTEKQKRIIAIINLALFLVFCGVVAWFIGRPMINFVSEPEKFRAWVEERGILGKLSFIGMMFFQVVIALVPGEPLEIGAGYAFGTVEGTILCVIGITLGSIFVFVLVKRFGIKFVEIFFSREKIQSLKFLRDKRKRNILLFTIFFLPGTPKDLLTYFVGLTDIKLSHIIFLSSVARLPSVITSAIGGNALGGGEYVSAITVFAITIVLSILGFLIYNYISKKRNNTE